MLQFRRLSILLVLGVLGCAVGDKEAVATKAAELENAPTEVNTQQGQTLTQPPDFTGVGKLYLIHEHQTLKLGEPMEDAFQVFLQPNKSVTFSDLPPELNFNGVKARGWETARITFGALGYQSRLAFAMEQERGTDDSRLLSIFTDYQTAFGKPTHEFTSPHVHYYFWERPGERLVICAVKPLKGDMKIAIALGEAKVMDVLRFESGNAGKDIIESENLFKKPRQ